MRTLVVPLLMMFSAGVSLAQTLSVIQEDKSRYANYTPVTEAGWDTIRHQHGEAFPQAMNSTRGANCNLTKRVYGWHPYWMGTVYNNYQWDLISDFCYFDYEVSSNTGNNTNTSFTWSTSGAVTAAINNGVNVHICASLFTSHSTFWNTPSAQTTFTNNMISLLQSRGGKGVNIDFEGMVSSDRIPFTNFMINFCNQLHAAIPGSEVSVALPAVDWGNVFDIPGLMPYVDYFIIMGYDYYWSGSTVAGPTDPLYTFQTNYNYSLSRSTTFYLAQGLPSNKLLMGLPYYGREWETVSNTIPSNTTGAFNSSRTYSFVRNNSTGNYVNPTWEPNSFSSQYAFQVNGNWRQCFIDDATAMRARFDVVNYRGLGGIGIWALGYDDGYNDYWNAISDKFTTCVTTSCTGTIWDMGGPGRNYYDRENYSYTIAPDNAYAVTLQFAQFDVELNYDTLWLYDGSSTNALLIGAYTGTNSPGTVTTTQGAITIRFKSDNATTRPGFTANWSCAVDNLNPVTTVAVNGNWQTQNFGAQFTDADNASGVEKGFYQVAHFNGSNWRANQERGFFHDDFDSTAIHPVWSNTAGAWIINGQQQLEQNDEVNGNTNLYAPLRQNLSNRYVYHWQGRISGTGNNRRAGFHFASDSGSLPNRGNSYFVWFRVDQGTLQYYKVVNDVFTLQQQDSFPFAVNTWYDYKVIYDRISGVVQVYINNVFVSQWNDPAPYANGKYISFRSGNCTWQINNLRVYRSRFTNQTTTVQVGNCSTCDMRSQNPAPAVRAGVIRSLNKDNANNLSAVDSVLVNVDWTAPVLSGIPTDENVADADTTTNLNQLSAFWNTANDPNSGVQYYEYTFATTVGDSDVVAWQNAILNTTSNAVLSLSPLQWYYGGYRAVNAAGLRSAALYSDGIFTELSTSLSDESNSGLMLYPIPLVNELYIVLPTTTSSVSVVRIYNASGALVLEQQHAVSRLTVDCSAFAAGVYWVRITTGEGTTTHEIIKR
jgi:spore germination protein YaaH